MSMAWEGTRRRYDLVRAVLAEVERTGQVPGDLAGEITDVFGDVAGFRCEVRRRWYLAFDARLDQVLENPPPNLERAVADLWHDLEREQPAFRVLREAYPAPTAADVHHRAALLAATGVDQSNWLASRRVS
jgi:hypothetical protein